MGNKTRKTEHAGPKKGKGAFYGRKRVAKLMSSRRRRAESKRQSSLRD